MQGDNKILIGTMPLSDVGRYNEKLGPNNSLEVVYQHECKSRGCKITVEIWGTPEDALALKTLIDQENRDLLKDHDYNFELANEVFDENASEAVCPACGTKFSTKLSECPDCGLAFVGGPTE